MDIQTMMLYLNYKNYGSEIYRTDKDGEINIMIHNKQKIKINKFRK